jgi:hypothetical protein
MRLDLVGDAAGKVMVEGVQVGQDLDPHLADRVSSSTGMERISSRDSLGISVPLISV